MAASKFTPENRAALIERFSLGMGVAAAATAVGLNEGTVKAWLKKGRKDGTGPHATFVADVDRAREQGRNRKPMDEDELICVVSEAARKGSVQAMKLRHDMLEAAKRKADDPEEQPKPGLGSLDELAERRAAREVVG